MDQLLKKMVFEVKGSFSEFLKTLSVIQFFNHG